VKTRWRENRWRARVKTRWRENRWRARVKTFGAKTVGVKTVGARSGVQQRQLQCVVLVKALHALGKLSQVVLIHVHVQLVVRRHDRAHDRALHAHASAIDHPGGVLTRGDLGLAHFFEFFHVHTL